MPSQRTDQIRQLPHRHVAAGALLIELVSAGGHRWLKLDTGRSQWPTLRYRHRSCFQVRGTACRIHPSWLLHKGAL